MAAGSATDLECAVYRAGGLSGSLMDMRKEYARLAAGGSTAVYGPLSTQDSWVKWQWAGVGDDSNLSFLTRRWYLNTVTQFTAKNSIGDLRYERFGGNV
jgi:hypothetical protein